MYYDYIQIRQNVIKKLQKYKSYTVKTLLTWTPTPPPRRRHLLQHAPLGLYALHQAKNLLWITKHIRMPHCTVHYGSDVDDDLVWVRRMYSPLLLNNNLLVGRDMTRMGINFVFRICRRG